MEKMMLTATSSDAKQHILCPLCEKTHRVMKGMFSQKWKFCNLFCSSLYGNIPTAWLNMCSVCVRTWAHYAAPVWEDFLALPQSAQWCFPRHWCTTSQPAALTHVLEPKEYRQYSCWAESVRRVLFGELSCSLQDIKWQLNIQWRIHY